ncbi:MAG TPA: ABC transporter substrate-binding protein [Gaiellaceae bacterium]|nr:ABC transporter substrate-binding protein [Gaiellaceae bacterium]
MRLKLTVLLGATVLLATVAAGCGGGGSKKSSSSTSGAGCSKDSLNLVTSGKLTVGTDNPAYPPWFGGTQKKPWKVSDPNSGEGFESAVAYAVAKQLGFSKGDVKWVVVPFDQSFRPGSKNFDFDINQISFTPQRAKAVSFSDSYYNVNQALIGIKGSPITKVKTQADIKRYKLGVQLGTTSYQYVVKNIKPSQQPSVYNNSQDVTSALKAHQIDGVVVDLPTAFFITGSGEVPNSEVVGQFPTVGTPEHFGMVFSKGNSLVSCVNKALAKLKSDGTLPKIQREWLSNKASAPVLK